MKILLLRHLPVVVLLFCAFAVMHSQGTQTQRFPQFDNEDVKVWKSVVMPNAPLPTGSPRIRPTPCTPT
jgi:hypothetical protein